MDLIEFVNSFGTHDKVVDFFIKNELIYKDFKCEKENCGANTSLVLRKEYWVFRCCKSGCR